MRIATDSATSPAAGTLPVYVFLSYASEDRPVAQRLYQRLLDEPLLKDQNGAVWMDRPEIDGGDRWKKEIDKALYASRIVLALLTPRSIDPKRRWIRYEQVEARRLFRRVVPLMIEDCALPGHLQDLHYVDFREDWERGYRDLRNAVGRFAPRLGPSGAAKFVDATPPLSRGFVGREEDLARVFSLIDGESKNVPTGRLAVAIQGMGGTGKTMLAQELVRRIGVHYPGGVAIEARGQSPASAQAVLQKWAKYMLGRYPQPQWTVIDVRSHLKERYGEVLVLLDDVPAEDLKEVRQLLGALPPDATRIVTTRLADIGTDLGCLVHPLADFDDADALSFLRHRLRGKGPAPPVATLHRLVKVVGGHPLSLELVTANFESTRDLDEDLDDSEQEARGGRDRGDCARHPRASEEREPRHLSPGQPRGTDSGRERRAPPGAAVRRPGRLSRRSGSGREDDRRGLGRRRSPGGEVDAEGTSQSGARHPRRRHGALPQSPDPPSVRLRPFEERSGSAPRDPRSVRALRDRRRSGRFRPAAGVLDYSRALAGTHPPGRCDSGRGRTEKARRPRRESAAAVRRLSTPEGR